MFHKIATFGVYCFLPMNTSLEAKVEIISIPDEELFSETHVWCTASYFVKLLTFGFVAPPPPLI